MHRTTSKLFLTLGATLMFSHLVAAEMISFAAPLESENQVPPIASSAGGTVVAEFDTETLLFRWVARFDSLTGPATAAHFHGPAMVGENAGVAFPIEGDLDSPLAGEVVLTQDQADQLLGGLWYLNIHTQLHPGGELRGQLVPQPSVPAAMGAKERMEAEMSSVERQMNN